MSTAHRHTVVFGGDFRLYNQTPFQGGVPSGSYGFGREFTQGPDPQRATLTAGDGFASLLLGYGSGSINRVPAFAIRNYYFAGYVNDDIRLGKLTINVGVRYEYEQPRTERYNRFANFDFGRKFPIDVAAYPNLQGALSFAGRENPRGQFDPAYNNLGPRFGLAYRINSRTVVRAGFGLFYAPRIGSTSANSLGATGAQIDTAWVSSLDGVTPLNPLSNPFPQGLLQPPSSRAEQLFLGQGLAITDRGNRNNNYTEQWNLSVQRELPGQIGFEGAYSGSRGIRNTMLMEWNQLNPSYQSLKADLSRQVANPFFGLVRTGTLAQATVAQSQLLRPYPQYTNISTNWQNMAASTYHSYQMKIEKRFSNSMNFLVAYTVAKLIDNSSGRVFGFNSFTPEVQNFYDLRSERAVSEADVSQRLVISHTIDLPFGRGKPVLGNLPGALDRLTGGWSVSGVATFFTGFPLRLSSAGNSGVSGSRVLRPNSTGKSAGVSGDVQTRLSRFFDTNAFTIPEPFTFGNTGRTLPDVRGPGRRSFDLSLSKLTPITERFKAIFRAEAYNLTNTPYFSLPGTSLGSARA
ncbi:MAG: TonB-dependent receptor, partial [Acidobacteria bacterium]|nr:TonB-dependent receptor [Acidobacteriota bacterium]